MTAEQRAAAAVQKWVREGALGLRLEHYLAEAIRDAEDALLGRCLQVAADGAWVVLGEDYYQTFDCAETVDSLCSALKACSLRSVVLLPAINGTTERSEQRSG